MAGTGHDAVSHTALSNTLRSLLAGGIAGSLAKTTVAPLERVKILFQVHNLPVSMMQSIRHIVKHEGVPALFKGNTAVCVRIFPYSGIQYVAYDYCKARFFPPDARNATAIQRLSAGACAGVSAVACTYPLDVVRVRLACQSVGGAHPQYKGIVHCLFKISRDEGGVSGWYRGVVPTLIGIVPYAAINFSTYEYLKTSLQSYPELCKANGDPVVWARLACGAIAGSLGQTVVYPLDTVRRRMQMTTGPFTHLPLEREGRTPVAQMARRLARTPAWLQLLLKIKREEGLRGLFRGITINYIRVVPMVSVSFVSYDLLKEALGVTAGVAGHGAG